MAVVGFTFDFDVSFKVFQLSFQLFQEAFIQQTQQPAVDFTVKHEPVSAGASV